MNKEELKTAIAMPFLTDSGYVDVKSGDVAKILEAAESYAQARVVEALEMVRKELAYESSVVDYKLDIGHETIVDVLGATIVELVAINDVIDQLIDQVKKGEV